MKKARLNVYINQETFDRVEAMAKKLGTTKTAVASMAIQAGMDALILSINPDFKAFFEEQIRNDLATNRTKSPK